MKLRETSSENRYRADAGSSLFSLCDCFRTSSLVPEWPLYKGFVKLVSRSLSLRRKKQAFSFFASLACSHDFLSMIFGIFGKFRVDIVKKKNYEIFFFIEKILEDIRKNNFWELQDFTKDSL